MTQAQLQLQNALTTTFLTNLAFLSEYDKELYEKVDALSRMIENGTYQEKYILEFLQDSGDFDVYDVVNDKYLYNKQPKRFNDNLINKVKFDTEQSIFTLQDIFTVNGKVSVKKENRFETFDLKELTHLTLLDAQEYTNITKDYLQTKIKNIKKIEKFIFLGTLLGRHIPQIAAKVDASSYLVLERNLEIFRLSLFLVDYTVLAKKGAIFSIMDDDINENDKIQDYLNIDQFNNYLLKISTTNINTSKYIDSILNAVSFLDHGIYDYTRRLYIHLNRTTKRFLENYNFLEFKKLKESCNFFNDKPILYIAAGPSVDENLEWIKDNQDRFFIVCVAKVFRKLVAYDIQPNMVSTLDEQEMVGIHFDDAALENLNKDTIFLVSSITSERVLEKIKDRKIFLYEIYYTFLETSKVHNGFSVGELTLAMLLEFNPKNIYMLGLDLALDQKTGSTHSSSLSNTKLDLTEKQDRSSFHVKKSLVKTKGNFIEDVFTTPIFFMSITCTNYFTTNKDKDLTIYNLSTNGAKFENTIPKKVEDIKIDDFPILDKNLDGLYNILKDNSVDSLDKKVKENVKNEIEFLQNDFKNILKDIENNNNISYDEFIKTIHELVKKTTSKPYIKDVILSYYGIHLTYLSYYFNNKDLKAPINKFKPLKEVFIKQMSIIVDDIILCLERLK